MSVVSMSSTISAGAFSCDSRNAFTSSSSTASFQNVIFLYRSLMPVPRLPQRLDDGGSLHTIFLDHRAAVRFAGDLRARPRDGTAHRLAFKDHARRRNLKPATQQASTTQMVRTEIGPYEEDRHLGRNCDFRFHRHRTGRCHSVRVTQRCSGSPPNHSMRLYA